MENTRLAAANEGSAVMYILCCGRPISQIISLTAVLPPLQGVNMLATSAAKIRYVGNFVQPSGKWEA